MLNRRFYDRFSFVSQIPEEVVSYQYARRRKKRPNKQRSTPQTARGGGVVTGPATGFSAGVLGIQTGDFGTGTGGPIIEQSPSPSPEVLGDGIGNVGIGGANQAGIANQSFLGFMQTQRALLGILVGLALLFVFNFYFRRAS